MTRHMAAELVSIVVPCYNGQDHLAQALESVLWQTHAAWECILVDDGSTDRSAAIFAAYAGRDARFRYHRQENHGPAAARNAGIELARGAFVQFLDDDDLLLPRRLEVCVGRLRQDPGVDVAYSEFVSYRPAEGFARTLSARMPGDDAARALLFEQSITFATPIHSFLFRREVIAAARFDAGLGSYAEDVECWVRIAAAGARFAHVDEVLVVYRLSRAALTSHESALMAAKVRVLVRYAGHPLALAHPDPYRRALAHWRQRLAIGHFMDRSFPEGLGVLREVWAESGGAARIKMLGWWFLMHLFSPATIVRVRAWMVRFTPLRWGGWRRFRSWDPPAELRALMSRTTAPVPAP